MSNNDRLIWEKRIKEYKDIGLSGTQWCRENNLSYHPFKYWHYKISDKLRNKEHLKQSRERIAVTTDANSSNSFEHSETEKAELIYCSLSPS
ncbi:IS66 family insertion sequence element accessory protein TnpA, partial [Paramaledivibacter caminithermalis]